MQSADLKTSRQEVSAAIQQALRNNDEQAYSDAMAQMMTVIGNELREEMNGEIEAARQSADSTILAQRGVRQLTSEEKSFYQKFGEAVKAKDPKQALSNLDVTLPETVIAAVFEDLRTNHPLLSRINFISTKAAVKILVNTNGQDGAVWGDLCDEIVKEVLGGFKEIDAGLCKLSAFLPVCKQALEFGPEWLDRFVRETLYEMFATGLEAGFITGTGNKSPIGMDRQVGDDVVVVGGVYPQKELITVERMDIATVGNLLSLLAVNSNGKARPVNNVIMIVNPADKYGKVDPATMVMAPDGSYRRALPYNIEVIESNAVEVGEAVFGMAKKYFAAIGSPKEGRIEYSDHVHFLEDERVYIIKGFGYGRAYDDNDFLRLDISGLKPLFFQFENVTHTPSDDATLSGLKIGALTLTPTFDPDEDTYTASTTNASNTVLATVNNAAANVVITVNDEVITNGSAATWEAGENDVEIVVTAEDGTTETYTVTVTKS